MNFTGFPQLLPARGRRDSLVLGGEVRHPNRRSLPHVACRTTATGDGQRSAQGGFSRSIRLIFQSRFHFLICRSRTSAVSRRSWASNHMRRSTLYLAVKPGMACDLCCQTRRVSSKVELM